LGNHVSYETVGFVERPAQPRLRYGVSFPPAPARAAVLITPGYLEHLGRYAHVVELWRGEGFAVAVHDPRGQGESEGRRGHVDRFSDYVGDVYAILDTLNQHPDWRGLGAPILVGHSMGALITAHVALGARAPIRGLGLLSPFFGLALPAPAWKVWFARRVSRYYPTYTEKSGVDAPVLTHDLDRARSIAEDPLCRERVVTARWFTEMEAAQREVRLRFPALELPMLCLASGDDKIADLNATVDVFAQLMKRNARAELRVQEHQYHELHQELDWRNYMLQLTAAFKQW
jgi:alpha-beta hydrolase superfamily lysophospholipase